MSAYEYWSKAEALMADYQGYDTDLLAGALAEAGYILPADRDVVAEEITAHDGIYGRDDGDADCKCGKWLEYDQWEWPDHMGDVLEKWITKAGEADR